jgi:hypothetical protein
LLTKTILTLFFFFLNSRLVVWFDQGAMEVEATIFFFLKRHGGRHVYVSRSYGAHASWPARPLVLSDLKIVSFGSSDGRSTFYDSVLWWLPENKAKRHSMTEITEKFSMGRM